MKERPILFSTPMVNAIQEDRKTQTRRIMKQKFPHGEPEGIVTSLGGWPVHFHDGTWDTEWCPYGQIGDVLWVRETWAKEVLVTGPENFRLDGYLYAADFNEPVEWRWKPSIHMPRAACRIRLKITDIRVERLQDISEADAIAEGIEWRGGDDNLPQGNTNGIDAGWINYMETGKFDGFFVSPIASYQSLWEKINGTESLEQNPWVWVITFEKI